MVICCHAALDGQNKLKLYWIDLIDSARLQLEDLALTVKCTINIDLATEYLKKPMQALF